MKLFKQYCFFLVIFLLVTCANSEAQSTINGDTIYVDTQAEIVVLLPSKPTEYTTSPIDAPYNFISFSTGFTIRAKVKNSKPAPWTVVEGKRTHRFVLVYKRNINYNNPAEMEHIFSSVKAIEEHNRRKEDKKTAAAETKSDAVSKTSGKDNASFQFYSLLESGNDKFEKKQYEESKTAFDKAHALKPDDPYTKQRLEDVKLKLAEKKQKEDQKLQGVYKQYIADGEKALKKNKLNEAKIAFEQALVINPSDVVAKNNIAIIADKENQLKQEDDKEGNYNKMIDAADKSFVSGDYNDAKTAYKKALAIIKRPWPQDQLNKIDKLEADKASKEIADKKLLAQKTESDRQEKELQILEKKYYEAIQAADKSFAKGDLEKAKTGYNNAQDIISNRPWPKEQISKIDKLIADNDLKEKTAQQKKALKLEKERREKEALELENKFNDVVKNADRLFKLEDYTGARSAYQSAIAIIKKPWPEEQIRKIDKIEADRIAQAKAEKARLEKEKTITAKYTTTVEAADAALAKNDLNKAKRLYLDASEIKPSEDYPKQRLNGIRETIERLAAAEKERKERIAAEAALKRKYDLAMSKGKSYVLKEDLANAKEAYREAVSLKPAEAEAQAQLKLVTDKLDEIARINEQNEKYEAKAAQGDNQLIAKNYDAAILTYKEALAIKPTETYPNSQIKYIQSEIKNLQKEKEENDKREAFRLETENESKFRDWMDKANKSTIEKNYEVAKQQYAEALKIYPEHDYAKTRFRIVNDQLKMAKGKKDIAKNNEPSKKDNSTTVANDSQVTAVVPQKQTSSPYEFQANPIPYSAEELKAKYPAIDFTTLPPEQPFNDEATDTKENTRIFNQVLTDKPRLDISDKSEKIKLICQGINFEDRNVYVKLLIQNNSDNDFLTGSMMLTWTRKLGNHIKLYPLYLYPAYLPIVKPGHEAVIIYVCKSYNISDDEKLKFELNDRMNKIKLELNFKGSVYNEESVRY